MLTYVGSASVTGLFLLAVFVVRPPQSGFEMVLYLLVAFALMFGTIPHRKGFAIGLLYVHKLLAGEDDGEPTGGRPKPR